MNKFLVIFCLITTKCISQNENSILSLNPHYKNNGDYREVIGCLDNYFNNKIQNTSWKPYWSSKDTVDSFVDIEIVLLQNSEYYQDYFYYKPTLIFIDEFEGLMRAKVAFISSKSEFAGIYNFYLEKDEQSKQFKIVSSLRLNTLKWNEKTIDEVHYISAPNIKVDTLEIVEMKQKIESFNLLFGIQLNSFDYYVCNNYKEIQEIRGFDYHLTTFNSNEAGSIADIYNKRIFAGNKKFSHPHELIHLYTSQKYLNRYHSFWDEGIATFLGGSIGKSLEWHLSNLNAEIKNHPIDFQNLLDLQNRPSIKKITNVDYAIAGLLCKKIYEKHGILGIDKVFNSGQEDDYIYTIIEKLLLVKKENMNDYIKKELSFYE
ncbi:MAG: hypothetical protein ACK4R6_04795 [Spirosomataceae bacterium]